MLVGNEFNLILGDDGRVGIQGITKFNSAEELEDTIKRIGDELRFGFKTQLERLKNKEAK